MTTKEMNELILEKTSDYLIYNDSFISYQMIDEMKKMGLTDLESFKILFSESTGINDKYLINNYINNMISMENQKDYVNDAYYKNINFSKTIFENWDLSYDEYKPYQLFVRDDFHYNFNGEIYPQLGFFKETFKYPVIKENGITWMSITPNEINTMRKPIDNAKGKILVIGLGLGYYPYMTSLKKDVSSITIIEKDINIIKLFKDVILPQFEFKDKIKIINEDAYVYLDNMDENEFDYAFFDIWHDVSDGMIHYRKLKNYESKIKNKNVDYWIMNSIKAYIK